MGADIILALNVIELKTAVFIVQIYGFFDLMYKIFVGDL